MPAGGRPQRQQLARATTAHGHGRLQPARRGRSHPWVHCGQPAGAIAANGHSPLQPYARKGRPTAGHPQGAVARGQPCQQ
ncbi:hypothetical protein BHE74_00041843 [Ensete ventricosum]|nr:hypothetical protein GW17_00041983 [Ensete ventricosum]RWW51786.1 hypothetical protein BHE74_00041843 [Ensete ventricosum]